MPHFVDIVLSEHFVLQLRVMISSAVGFDVHNPGSETAKRMSSFVACTMAVAHRPLSIKTVFVTTLSFDLAHVKQIEAHVTDRVISSDLTISDLTM